MSDPERPSRVISSGPVEARRWEAPPVSAARQQAARPAGLMTTARLEEMERQAREEGFQSGHAEGLQAGRKKGETEMRKVAARLEQLLDAMARPLAGIDRRVEEELTALALAVAGQILRHELQTDPEQVIAVVREAIAALPVAAGEVRIFLNPEDAALVRKTIDLKETERPWRIVEEPSMGRGGARIVTSCSEVDVSLERRLEEAVTVLWAGGTDGSPRADNANEATSQTGGV